MNPDHHVLILGATGRTGGQALAQLLQRRIAVRAIVRSAGRLPAGVADDPPLAVVEADLLAMPLGDLVDAAEAVGPIGVLANVAGIMDHFVPVTEVDDELWERVLGVNLTAPMRLCRAIIPLMTARGGGSIVNIASVAGLGGSGAGASYVASKHAVIGLTKSIAFTYSPQGIRCNAVCPGGTETNIGTTAAPTVMWAFERQMVGIALGERTAKSDEIATAISWLACGEASNVNGMIMSVDGGWKSA